MTHLQEWKIRALVLLAVEQQRAPSFRPTESTAAAPIILFVGGAARHRVIDYIIRMRSEKTAPSEG